MRTAATTALLLTLLLAGLSGCGGSGDGTPSVAVAEASTSTDTTSDTTPDTTPGSTSGDTAPVGSAPQAVCDFADAWRPIDDQLSSAEGDVDNAALWGDAAVAMESAVAPVAITVWPVLRTRVRKYADLLAAGDTGGAQAFLTSGMPELEGVHGAVHDLFAQACP
jgi:hypothetical protein